MRIDKIYIISLDAGNPEVQRRLANKLDDMMLPYPVGFEIIQGFDGRSGQLPVGYATYKRWNLGEATQNDWWKRDVQPGEAGCGVSHRIIWQKIIDENINAALILEDDFKPIAPVPNPIVPDGAWDIAFLGRNALNPGNEVNFNGRWKWALSSYNTHAYILTNRAAHTLVEGYNYAQNLIAPDEFLSATFSRHQRDDIAAIFPAKLRAIAPITNWVIQDRPQEESLTEPVGANVNLIRESTETGSYFEILDDSDWDSWKSKYLNHTVAKGEYDLMLDDLGNNIYEFQLFTDKFCKEAIALAESLDKWTVDRHEFYPTNDVLLPELGLDRIYNRVLKEVVYPMCIHIWTLEGAGWDTMQSENFMARYTTDRQSHLALHHDFSHVTMVVKLNDEFEGGGTWFPKYKILSNPKRVGTATLHPGMVTHLHGARPIYAGKRYICVSFMRKVN